MSEHDVPARSRGAGAAFSSVVTQGPSELVIQRNGIQDGADRRVPRRALVVRKPNFSLWCIRGKVQLDGRTGQCGFERKQEVTDFQIPGKLGNQASVVIDDDDGVVEGNA